MLAAISPADINCDQQQEPRTPSPIRSRVISNNQESQQDVNDFPLLNQFSREPTQRPQGRPFPDSDNIFLPAPTPSASPSPSPRFPSRISQTENQASPVRSNGQFSFGELPVRRRRNQNQNRRNQRLRNKIR